jgi:hypothetical protein
VSVVSISRARVGDDPAGVGAARGPDPQGAGPGARNERACDRILFVTRSWLSWGILSALGLVAILLPDTDRRLFSLSEGHGPSLIDGVGVMFLVAGWAALDIGTWRRRRGLSLRRDLFVLMSTAGIAAISVVIWSVFGRSRFLVDRWCRRAVSDPADGGRGGDVRRAFQFWPISASTRTRHRGMEDQQEDPRAMMHPIEWQCA